MSCHGVFGNDAVPDGRHLFSTVKLVGFMFGVETFTAGAVAALLDERPVATARRAAEAARAERIAARELKWLQVPRKNWVPQ